MIFTRTFRYEPGRTERTLHIWLPDDYNFSNEHYPVMYFFDGHNLFYDTEATYGTCWGLKEFLERWDKPIIIVGIECGHGPNERLIEYAPYRFRYGNLHKMSPLGDATMQWIIHDVKPVIDLQFRTWPHREATGIAGSSMGGLMAYYGLVRYNDVFSKAACLSGSFGFFPSQVICELNRHPVQTDTRIYLSWGTKEVPGIRNTEEEDLCSRTCQLNRRISDRFRFCGAYPMLRCQVGGAHCETDWARLVPEFMEFLWKS